MSYKKIKGAERQLKTIYKNICPFLDENKKALFNEILQRLSIYQVAFVGAPGLGKTTALDAIIQKKLMPASGSGATTGVPVYIYHHEKDTASTVVFKNNTTQEIEPNPTELENYINSVNHKNADVKEIVIKTPVPFIAQAPFCNEFCLIDTPGEGTAGAKDHTETTRHIIKQTDGLVIFVNQRQLTDGNVNFLSRDIAKVRQDLIHNNSGELNFDDKVFVVLSRMDEDEAYFNDKDGTYLENKKNNAVQILEKVGFKIKPDKVFALAAETGLYCLLVAQEMGKSLEEISLTDLENHIQILQPGTAARSRATKLKGVFERLADAQSLNQLTLTNLYRFSGLKQLLQALYKYLNAADLKTSPLKKAVEQAVHLAEEQDSALKQQITERQQELTQAEKEENKQREKENKDYLFETNRIKARQLELTIAFERDIATLQQQQKDNEHKLKDLPLQLKTKLLEAENRKKEIEKTIELEKEKMVNGIKKVTQDVVDKYQRDEISIDGWEINGWDCYLPIIPFELLIMREPMELLIMREPMKLLIMRERMKLLIMQRLIKANKNISEDFLRKRYKAISQSLYKAHYSHHSNDIVKMLNHLRSIVTFFQTSLQTSLLIAQSKSISTWRLKEFTPRNNDLFFDPQKVTIPGKQSVGIITINGKECDVVVRASPINLIDTATTQKSTELEEIVKSYVQTLNDAFKEIKIQAKSALQLQTKKLENENKRLADKVEAITQKYNQDNKDLEDSLNSYTPPPNMEDPPQNETISTLKEQIDTLQEQRKTLLEQTLTPLKNLLNQLTNPAQP